MKPLAGIPGFKAPPTPALGALTCPSTPVPATPWGPGVWIESRIQTLPLTAGRRLIHRELVG